MSMSVGERDKKMSDIASIAPEAFAEDPTTNERKIKISPQDFLQHTIPYLTVRALHRLEETLKRQEKALKGLEADSRWIKRLTFALAALTIALVFYAWRLHSPPEDRYRPTAISESWRR